MTADIGENWDYSDKSGRGPSAWPKYYGAGQYQSPINILVDFCDLHQSRRTNCAAASHSTAASNNQQNQISRQLKSLLNINNNSTTDNDHHHHHKHHRSHHHNNNNNHHTSNNNKVSSSIRRDHLDSVGEDEAPASATTAKAIDNGSGQVDRRSSLAAEQAEIDQLSDKRHQSCKQKRQNTRYCVTNKKIFLGYPRYLNTLKLTNTGHTWQADLPAELSKHTLLCGPALADREYRLAQFHCHWGADCQSGSEHQVNGQSFSAEIHFVHWNCSIFKSAQEASRHKHGLAVLGVFVEALDGDQYWNKHLDKIIRGLDNIADWPNEESHASYSGRSTTLEDTKLDLKKLFPVNRWDYASYEGSLTTPPLSEVVDWIVFLEPIRCSSSQIEQFRRLRCPSGPLLSNCRPVQALNARTVTIWTHSPHSH